MKINTYSLDESNTEKLKMDQKTIEIKRGRWINNMDSHPMEFDRISCFDQKRVYFLYLFGTRPKVKEDGTIGRAYGKHISLSYLQNQKFLWLQNKHWFQNKDNMMWLINVLVALGATIAALVPLFK